MKRKQPSWIPTRKWADSIFDTVSGNDWHDDAVYIAKTAQKELLQHIFKYSNNDGIALTRAGTKRMLEELEQCQ